MNNEVSNWLESAEYDLETADNMLQAGRYIYAVFMCHLSLEKALKAVIQAATNQIPPKTHDLEYLLTLADLSPDEQTQRFAAELSNISISTRYPIDFNQTKKYFSQERAQMILEKTREFYGWTIEHLKT